MMIRFVPENVGLEAIPRQQFIAEHVTTFANELYNDNPNALKAISFVDGIYSYIEKVGNYRTLRKSYSIRKGYDDCTRCLYSRYTWTIFRR